MVQWKQGARQIFSLILILFSFSSFSSETISILNLDGPIDPANAEYLTHGIKQSQSSELIIIKMNTPGGFIKQTHQIVDAILASKVPIVTYVAPEKAHIAREGLLMFYSGTIAVMTPGTILKLRHSDLNVNQMEKLFGSFDDELNAISEFRGRYIHLDQHSKKEIDATAAFKFGMIDFLASNPTNLVKKLDGYFVSQHGKRIQLHTRDFKFKIIPISRYELMLRWITDPTVVFILLVISIDGIVIFLLRPKRATVFGIIGLLSSIPVIYSAFLLPIDWFGLLMVLLGMALLINGVLVPSFWLFVLPGTLFFIFGSMALLYVKCHHCTVHHSVIFIMAALNFLVLKVFLVWFAKPHPYVPNRGLDQLIGEQGRALTHIHLHGQAIIRGEIWNVYSKSPITMNKTIKVIDNDGMRLKVQEINDSSKSR